MDRRKQKTLDAIYDAFTSLIGEKDYSSITIQEIIDRANIGRSTFYTHFQTKEELSKSLCKMLYDHIFESAANGGHHHGAFTSDSSSSSIFCHILHHLQEDDHHILTLLSCDSNGMFAEYFKNEMAHLISHTFTNVTPDLPEDFVINHISCTFLEIVQWWIKNDKKETPEKLEEYFYKTIEALIM